MWQCMEDMCRKHICMGKLEKHKKEEEVSGKVHITDPNNDRDTFVLQQSLEQR